MEYAYVKKIFLLKIAQLKE